MERDVDILDGGEVSLAESCAVTWYVMGEDDVSDVTGLPEMSDAGARRKEGKEIVPGSEMEEASEEAGLLEGEEGVSVHFAPSL